MMTKKKAKKKAVTKLSKERGPFVSLWIILGEAATG